MNTPPHRKPPASNRQDLFHLYYIKRTAEKISQDMRQNSTDMAIEKHTLFMADKKTGAYRARFLHTIKPMKNNIY